MGQVFDSTAKGSCFPPWRPPLCHNLNTLPGSAVRSPGARSTRLADADRMLLPAIASPSRPGTSTRARFCLKPRRLPFPASALAGGQNVPDILPADRSTPSPTCQTSRMTSSHIHPGSPRHHAPRRATHDRITRIIPGNEIRLELACGRPFGEIKIK
jgi:hypothetical protein